MEFSQFPMAHIDLYCSLMLCPYPSKSFSQYHKGIELLFMRDARPVRVISSCKLEFRKHRQAYTRSVLIWWCCPVLLLKSIWRNKRKANVIVVLFYITVGDDKVSGNFYMHKSGGFVPKGRQHPNRKRWLHFLVEICAPILPAPFAYIK